MTLKTNSSTENAILHSGLAFVRETNGAYEALGMQGAPEAIHGVYLLLFNSGATGGELLDNGSKTFAYVWLKPETLAYCLAQWELAMLVNAGKVSKADKVTATRRFYALNAKWLRWFKNLPSEDFTPKGEYAREVCGLGVTEGMNYETKELAYA